jgi:glycosyltransferase involved in cell wall biosynthesis
MLPFFFRHYDPFVDRYVIFDDGSTDRTLSILAAHPRVEVRQFVRSDPDSFVFSERELSDSCWKDSRGAADWVIVTDIDEHLFHPRPVDYLRSCTANGITLIPSLGFQMISEKVPQPGETLCESYRVGAPWGNMMKPSVFDPNQIAEINFFVGRHRADPEGIVRVPSRDEMLLLHYKYLGIERTHARNQELRVWLGSTDLDNDFGHKYVWSLEELKRDWTATAKYAVDLARVEDFSRYPLERWWEKYRTG